MELSRLQTTQNFDRSPWIQSEIIQYDPLVTPGILICVHYGRPSEQEPYCKNIICQNKQASEKGCQKYHHSKNEKLHAATIGMDVQTFREKNQAAHNDQNPQSVKKRAKHNTPKVSPITDVGQHTRQGPPRQQAKPQTSKSLVLFKNNAEEVKYWQKEASYWHSECARLKRKYFVERDEHSEPEPEQAGIQLRPCIWPDCKRLIPKRCSYCRRHAAASKKHCNQNYYKQKKRDEQEKKIKKQK